MKFFRYLFSILLIPSALLTSCVDTNPMEVLNETDTFRNVADAKNSVKGLYGKVMELAEQTVVLNELRADLMDVTTNADHDLQDISYFTSRADNPYVNTVPYYSVVQNCNDMLYHFNDMLANHKFTQDEYDELYSDVMTVRCWTYFQLGTLFGRVPYVTEPIQSLADLKLTDASFKTLDELIPLLITCMESVPTLEQYSTASQMTTKPFNTHNLASYFLNKRCFLTELYLWDDQYYNSAKSFRDFQMLTESDNKRYKNYTWVYQGTFEGAYMITYTRYKESDVNQLQNMWSSMFDYEMETTFANYEQITCMTFDKSYDPVYPFVRLFGNEGVGKYLLKPSQNVIDNYWGKQVQSNGYMFDGRGLNGSYKLDEQGRPVITKYLYDYVPSKPYEVMGKWFIYRSAPLNLLYAEACNRYAETGAETPDSIDNYVDGDTLKPYTAYRNLTKSFINSGVKNNFVFKKPSGVNFPGDSISKSGWTGGSYFSYPFDFDARRTDVPSLAGGWRDGSGCRGRASLQPVTYNVTATTQPEVRFWERAILDELALESAFEGHRWTDILRVARRWNKEDRRNGVAPTATGLSGTALLNELIGKKFAKNGKAAPVFLDDESNWYLPAKFN